MYIIGIILAAGKGKRMNSHTVNKVSLNFAGKPMIAYAVELLEGICSSIVVVVGAFSHSVKDSLKSYNVMYAQQKKRLGTAHTAKVGLETIKASPTPLSVLVGYGDHMMFYKKETVKKLIKLQSEEKAAISLITADFNKPNDLAWGRVIRDAKGFIVDNVEQKDATKEQRKIQELNAGFYCFDYEFLQKSIAKVKKSPVSGEYYINALIHIAVEEGNKVVGLNVPFMEVGIGVNKIPELQKSQEIYLRRKDSR